MNPAVGVVAVAGLAALAMQEVVQASKDATGALLNAPWAENGGNLMQTAVSDLGLSPQFVTIPDALSAIARDSEFGMAINFARALSDFGNSVIQHIQNSNSENSSDDGYYDINEVDFLFSQ